MEQKDNKIGLNLDFFFPLDQLQYQDQRPSLPYYLSIVGERIVESILCSNLFVLYAIHHCPGFELESP